MSKTRFLILALLAVAGLSAGAIWIFNMATDDIPYSGPWELQRPRAEIEANVRQHIREADGKASQAIARRSAEFSQFIQSRKSGAQPFSEDIVSLYGKWRALKARLPFTKSDSHKKYVTKKFNQHIFTTEDLAAAVKRAIEDSIKDLESIENELAVALRQEILGRSLSPDEIPIATEEFKQSVERMVAASQWDTTKAAGSLFASEVVAQVGTQVFVRLGMSAGILATGAANSWWSFGAAFVIGIVVDIAWDWIDDPAGDIEQEMKDALDNLSINGSTAIKEEMGCIISQRSALWNKTVREIQP